LPEGDFDTLREDRRGDLWGFWLRAAEDTLSALWDNDVDAEYDNL